MTPGQQRDIAIFLNKHRGRNARLLHDNTEIIKATRSRLNNWRKAGYTETEIRQLNNDWIDEQNQFDERFND